MNSDMSNPIPACTLENILTVYNAKAKNPTFDIRQAVRAGLGDAAPTELMVTVGSRLIALTNLLLLQPELQQRPTDDGSVVHVGILRAAARAPLFPTSRPALLIFNLDSFLAVLAEESGSDGDA